MYETCRLFREGTIWNDEDGLRRDEYKKIERKRGKIVQSSMLA